MKALFLLLIFTAACTSAEKTNEQAWPEDLSEKSRQEIMSADIAMSEQAGKEGFHKALLAWADDSLVKPDEGKFPVIGKQSLAELWSGKEDTKAISWKPFRVDAARSGEMGYTLGHWTLTAPDTIYYGFYYTIWKKQDDGSWRWVVDGGNNTPKPD
jgi:ketosteroid isomerase-like protein